MNASRLVPFALLLVLLNGCGGGDKTTKPIVPADGLPAGTPAADSPAHLAQRLEATWENEVETEYAKLLTDDFRFHFSASSDPLLVQAYGDNWKRADEIAALTHVFHGFINAHSDTIPGASAIALSLVGVQYAADFDHPDSSTYYKKVVVALFDGMFEFPSDPSSITYPISSRQELYLVRGDAAVLPAGMAADSTHWYVRRWDDLSVSITSRKGPVLNPTTPVTLGRLKAQFHDAPPPVEPPDGLPAGTPQADSPLNLATRLEATWEAQNVTQYAKLLAADFRYHFSAATDPMLVDRYPNWGLDDEVESTQHLFDGFTNSLGEPVPGASRIELAFSGVSNGDDFQHADSTDHYRKLVIVLLDGLIEVPDFYGATTFNISARHELYLVRGDAAVLPPGAIADATRWYVRRWDDLSTTMSARKGPVIHPASTATLGGIKSLYRY